MSGTCIALAVAGTLIVLPAQEMTLSWAHTVELTRWEEDYLASPEGLAVVEARIESFGAGMEAPASAVRHGRWWSYRPALSALKEITLANSEYGGGYSVCWKSECRPLASLIPHGRQVTVTTTRCVSASVGPPKISGVGDLGHR